MSSCTYVLIYVDHILVTGSAPQLIQDVISKLNAHFALKQLGQVDYFLGIKVHHSPSWSSFIQSSQIYYKAKMENSKPIGSPMMSSCRLSKFGCDTMTDPTLCRSTLLVLYNILR
ncbi:hypothetical protein QL285_028665 [Trifolium repens]|nr:hypothetical protein QL285_028665 [Trifolium repens]